MSPVLRVLAVDDEQLALRRVELLLRQIDDVTLVGCARSGAQALDLIATNRPNVLLLDIKMAGMTGFDVVDQLRAPNAPLVIFVTAYDDFAVRAFAVSAVDYVTKPVALERLAQALDKARQTLAVADAESRATELRLVVEALRRGRAIDTPEMSQLWVERRGERIPVRIADLDWIEAERDYVRLHLLGTSYLMRETMSAFQSRLGPEDFLRVRRSALVRRDRIVAVRRPAYNDLRVQLSNGAEVRVGRTYMKDVRALIASRAEVRS